MATGTTARILISVGDTRKGLEFTDIDFQKNRNELALGIGKKVIDSIFDAAEQEALI